MYINDRSKYIICCNVYHNWFLYVLQMSSTIETLTHTRNFNPHVDNYPLHWMDISQDYEYRTRGFVMS
jgi:hypothetical protein